MCKVSRNLQDGRIRASDAHSVFNAYLIHCFYNTKIRCNRQKPIEFLNSAWKNTSNEKEKKSGNEQSKPQI